MTDPPYELHRPAEAGAGLLFLCDHASNALPTAYGTLGLDAALFATHIACDIGAAAVTRALAEAFGAPAVLAKIEKPKALEGLSDILDIADALMVARGDLGVELPLEAVPGRQKQIIRAARRAGKPVVVATQMLESMNAAPVPTRAEVSDVATAVFDGADAVMLSGETASGAYPVEAVQVMDRIAQAVENDPLYASILESQRNAPEETTADAIMAAVHEVTHTVHARAVVCWTKSGSTALRCARERPEAPIIVLTPLLETARRLAIGWGLHCVTTEDAHDLDDVTDRATPPSVPRTPRAAGSSRPACRAGCRR